MARARNRVIGALVLALVALAGAVAAVFRYDVGWLVLLAYVAGAAAAWYVFGALVGYAQAKAKTQLATGALAGVAEGLKRWAAQQQANAAPAAANTEQEGEQP